MEICSARGQDPKSSLQQVEEELWLSSEIALGCHPSQTEIRGTLAVKIRRIGITEVNPRAVALISSWDRDPGSQTIRLTHATTSATRYRIESSLPWISVPPQEWVQAESGITEVTVTASPAGQGAGTHQGKLTVVRVSDEDTSSANVPVGVEIPVVVSRVAPGASRETAPSVNRVAISARHLYYYLDEFSFRFNRRKSRSRGKLFYRLVQQAAAIEPTPYQSIVGGKPASRTRRGSLAVRCRQSMS